VPLLHRAERGFAAALIAAALVLGGAGVATAGDATTTTVAQSPVPHMIPRPNSGVKPQDVGDRGGAAQIGILVAIVGGLALIAFLVIRESRKARAAAGRR
jgi:hypothetical protein